MAARPIIFALANPDPEIGYPDARAARPDAIVATGRSDFPNQVNNVLGFPFLFRGALDVRATEINEPMKVAAAKALAALAREDVPDAVAKAYGLPSLHFGPEYLIPKPLDPRVLLWVAPAVAGAAMETGVARVAARPRPLPGAAGGAAGQIAGDDAHRLQQGQNRSPKRIVLAEGEHEKMIRAAHQLVEERIARPILLGNPRRDRPQGRRHAARPDAASRSSIPTTSDLRERYAQRLLGPAAAQGRHASARPHELILKPDYFAAVMVEHGRCGRHDLRPHLPLSRRPAPAAADHPHRAGDAHGRRRLPGDHPAPCAVLRRYDGQYRSRRRKRWPRSPS